MAMVIVPDTDRGTMEGKTALMKMILLISIMSIAGCTTSPSAPIVTPVPVPVTATAISTPSPAVTGPPVVISPAWTPETPATGHPYSKTYSFEGTGDYTQIFTTTSDGTWIYRMNYPGKEVFIVTIKDKHGDDIETLANEGGSYTGTKSVHLDAGTYYLDVSAAAPWTITMSTA
jgi:hypothetical protein